MSVVERRRVSQRDRIATAAVMATALVLTAASLCYPVSLRLGSRQWYAGPVPSEYVARSDRAPGAGAYPQGFHQFAMPPVTVMCTVRVGNLVYAFGWRDLAQMRRMRQRWWQRRLAAANANPRRR